jgi:hypothetical protein
MPKSQSLIYPDVESSFSRMIILTRRKCILEWANDTAAGI